MVKSYNMNNKKKKETDGAISYLITNYYPKHTNL